MFKETNLQLMLILPAMTYGAETWALTTQAKNKLAATQTNMGKDCVKHHIPGGKHLGKRENTKVIDVIEQVRRRKWTWAEHVRRIRNNRWTLRVTTWKPTKGKDLEEDRRDVGETN